MGTSFGRYKVAEELGRGAMGVVYRAVDPAIGRSVAIKSINRAYLESVGVRHEEYAERFQREAQVAGALNHPHIVKIFDLGPDYLVMEYVEGNTLAEVLRTQGRLPRETALRVLGEAASALDHAHAAGVVHRDIKPANVMVQPGGAVKVMDFGLARIESSTLTAAGEVLGSAAYMAPEAVLGQPADARSDIFSLAVVAYELLTGTRPFAGPTVSAIIQSVVRTTPRPARELDPTLPPEVDAIFARALSKDPAQRYPTAGELSRALAGVTWAPVPLADAPPSSLPGLAVDPAADTDPGRTTVILATASTIRPADGGPPAGGAPQEEGTATMLTVNADELAQPAAATAPGDATARFVAREPPAAGPPGGRAASEASADKQAASSGEGTAATVILRARPAEAPAGAGEAASPATVILPPPVSADATAGAQVPAAGPADKTIVMKKRPASRGARPAARQPGDQPPAVTVRMAGAPTGAGTPAASPRDEPAAAEPTPTVVLPAAPGPPATVDAAPAPVQAASTPPAAATPPAAQPQAGQPAPRPAAPKPAARAGTRSPVLFVVGVLAVVLLLFGAAAGGFYWLIRSQAAKEAATPPAPAEESAPAPAETGGAAAGATAGETETGPAARDATADAGAGESAGEAAAPPQGGDTAAAPAAPAAPPPATLVVTSDPAGASVTVGRRRRGRTPLRLSLPAGTLAVEVQKDGFKPWRESARLKAGETQRLQARLEPLPPARAAPTPPPAPAAPAVREGDLVPVGPDVTAPRRLSGQSPAIPSTVRRKLSGSAVVEFTVDIDGSISDPKIVESLGKVVDHAVVEAVKTWRYEPARSHGVRVRVVQRARFTYEQ